MMGTDKLEKFILDHKEDFDDLSPRRHVWTRIRKKFPVPVVRTWRWQAVAWRAAAVIAIFIASYFVHDFIGRDHYYKRMTKEHAPGTGQTEKMAGTLKEAEAFYTSQINAKRAEVFRFAGHNKEISQEITIEFSQLDSIYADLKRDLKDNADNEQVIEAMIQNYRIKLEILEDILSQLQKSKSTGHVNIHEI
jgi:hypothetical protein